MTLNNADGTLMTFDQVSDWARRHLLVEIGAGRFDQAVSLVVNGAWSNGYETAKRDAKKEARASSAVRE